MSQRTRWGFDRKAGAKHRPDQLVRTVRFPRPYPAPEADSYFRIIDHFGVTMASEAIPPIAIELKPGGVNRLPPIEIKREVRAPSQAPRRAVIGQHQAAKAPPAMKQDPAPRPDPAPMKPRKMKIRQCDIPSAMEALAATWGKK